MKLTVVSVAVLVLAGFIPSTHAVAQKSTPAADTSTRERKTPQATAPATKPAVDTTNSTATRPEPEISKQTSAPAQAEPAKTPQPQTNETAVKGEVVSKTVAEAKPPTDPIAALRDEIAETEPGPERIKLQLKLAQQLVSSGYKTEAVKELNAIANTDVFDPAGFYNLGNAFARLGDTEGAVNAYQKAIDQRQENYSRAYNNLGVVLLRVGRWDEAYDAFIKALKLENFHYAEASYNLGRLYTARGQRDLAVREWRRAVTVDPKHQAAADALANAGSEGRIEVESQSRTADTKPETFARTSGPAKTPAAKGSATSMSAKPLTLDPTSFDYLQRARNASEQGKMVDAVDNFRRVLSRQGGYFAPANLELSYALLSLKKYDEAISNLVEVSNRDGARYPVSYFHLARVYELQGNLGLAESAFQKAADTYGSTNSQFLLDISRVREKQGNVKGALEVLERYVAAMEAKGDRPSWADQRLAELRQKVGQSTAK